MSSSAITTPNFDLSLLRCAAGTDVGMRRDENQDSFGVIKRDAFHAYLVADGMGGAQGGATASRMAIASLSEALHNPDVRISIDSIVSMVERTNRTIFEKGSSQPAYAGMGTTLVGLVVTPETMLVVNVGDSRAYRIRGNSIAQISEDHTLVKELLQSGAIAPEDVHQHPVSHMLTRSLGPLADVNVECRAMPDGPQIGDVYVLCSDGLYNYVTPEDILAVIRQNPIDDANQILINLANQRGGSDNITALVITVGEKPPRGRKNSIPPVTIASDVRDAHELLIAPMETAAHEPPVIPPRVQEPVNVKPERRSAQYRSVRTGRGLQPLPTALLLGTTLLIGLILGSFARRIPSFAFYSSEPATTALEPEEEKAAQGQEVSQDTRPLAALAKQIGGDRSDAGGTNGSYSTDVRRPPFQLEQSIQRLQSNIQALGQSAPSTDAPALTQARAELARREKTYQGIENNLDVASRSVTLWLGRQVAFEGQQTSLDSLSEMARVGAYSPVVKEKLAAITSLSYQHREKADQLELHPGDTQIQADIVNLEAQRDKLKRELADEVLRAIKNALSRSYKDYETLKIQRNVAWRELQEAKREVEVQSTISGSDSAKREALRKTLEDQLESERKALVEARSFTPNSQPR